MLLRPCHRGAWEGVWRSQMRLVTQGEVMGEHHCVETAWMWGWLRAGLLTPRGGFQPWRTKGGPRVGPVGWLAGRGGVDPPHAPAEVVVTRAAMSMLTTIAYLSVKCPTVACANVPLISFRPEAMQRSAKVLCQLCGTHFCGFCALGKRLDKRVGPIPMCGPSKDCSELDRHVVDCGDHLGGGLTSGEKPLRSTLRCVGRCILSRTNSRRLRHRGLS